MRPTEAIEHHWALIEFYRTLYGGDWLDRMCGALHPWEPEDGHEPINPFAEHHLMSLKVADTYWVSSDMLQVAAEASKTMPRQAMLASDLPTPHGFLMFEEPIVLADIEDVSQVRVWGFTWSLAHEDGAGSEPVGVTIGMYADAGGASPMTGTDLYASIRGRTRPPAIVLVQVRAIEFGNPLTDAELARMLDGKDEGTHREWLRHETLLPLALWTLMGQPLAQTEDERPERAARRRLEKADAPMAHSPIRVVRLRRLSHGPTGAGEHAGYSHRFIVSGHWRNQWLPSRGVHRLQYIAAFVKGPATAPLIVRPTVRALVR